MTDILPDGTKLTLVSHVLCPYVQRAVIALTEKSVVFERITIDLADKPDWFRAISPLGKVPLLKIDRPGQSEAVLFESAAICEFIEETQSGPPLHPSDPITRAQHRAWIDIGSSILADIYAIETTADAANFARACKAVTNKFARVESVLTEVPYFAGEHFSLVDAAFGPVFRYFEIFDEFADFGVFAKTPKVTAWRQALNQRKSVQSAVVNDYPTRLRAFLDAHDSILRGIIRKSEMPIGRRHAAEQGSTR